MSRARLRRYKKPGVNFSPLTRSIIISLMNSLTNSIGRISVLGKSLDCLLSSPSSLPALDFGIICVQCFAAHKGNRYTKSIGSVGAKCTLYSFKRFYTVGIDSIRHCCPCNMVDHA